MRLKALVEVWYAGKARMPGDEFESEPGDDHNAGLLVAIEKASRVDAAPVRPAAAKVQKAEQAESLPLETPVEKPVEPVADASAEDESDQASPKPRRRYMRRDMQAED